MTVRKYSESLYLTWESLQLFKEKLRNPVKKNKQKLYIYMSKKTTQKCTQHPKPSGKW